MFVITSSSCTCLLCSNILEEIHYSSQRNKEIEKLAEEGYRTWSMLQSMSDNVDCWKRAYNVVKSNCLDMTKDEKLIFSWNVLLCYYEDTGREIPSCASSDIRLCTQQLSVNDFNIFTQLYNHGDSFCFYRESREWQERTDKTVHHLEEATSATVSLLESSIKKEEKLLDLQTKNLEMHSTTLSQGHTVLNTVTQTSKQLIQLNNQVHDSFSSIRNETEHYFNDIHTVMNWTNTKLESISGLQLLIRSSFYDVKMLLVFAVKMITIFILTSLPGLSFIRPYFYVLVIFSTLFDRLLHSSLCSWMSDTLKATSLFLFQCIFILLSIIHYLYHIWTQKDFTKENYKLLQLLYKQIVQQKELYVSTMYTTPKKHVKTTLYPLHATTSACAFQSIVSNIDYQYPHYDLESEDDELNRSLFQDTDSDYDE